MILSNGHYAEICHTNPHWKTKVLPQKPDQSKERMSKDNETRTVGNKVED